MLADRVREENEAQLVSINIKKHLDAARAKLDTLQVVRQDLKRDLALRDVAQLRAKQKLRPVTACDVREALIDKLRKERAFLLQALQELVCDLSTDGERDISVTTDRARITAPHAATRPNQLTPPLRNREYRARTGS